VRWGPIADAGVLASNADGTVEMLRRRTGLVPVPAVTALAALPALLAGATAAPGIAPPGWAHAARGLAVLNEPCFRHAREVAEPSAATAEADLREMLGSAEESAALALLREALSGEVARILRMPPASVTADATLARLGLDSLGGMELRVALEQRLRMPVPLTAVSDTLTLDALARRILAALRSAAPSDSGVAALLAAHEPGAAPILSKMPPSGSDLEAAA
jgi:acyl carrier protein